MFFSKLKSFTRDYFTLTSRERRGALVLAFIIIFQILVLTWIHFLKPPDPPDIDIYSDEVKSFIEETNATPETETTSRESGAKENKPVELFAFDPNTITDSGWQQLGLSEKQISVIRNYLSKGGHFRDAKSFSKMYCISADEFKKLEPYIAIAENKKTGDSTFVRKNFAAKKTMIVELNSADTLLLQQLPLIGAGRARMIFRYREKLGGFYSVDQLREVFTIDSTVFDALKPLVKVDPSKISKFNINNDSIVHPYIGKKLAYILTAYRKQHGNFKDIRDLRQVAVPDTQLYVKIAPYVTFE